ncbi:uncharacterized protein DNG_04555 [Cephalotrichum gorgonifer]|uniref:Uncharacterized protein n=1 Tax=Cephalotrichum gorgonifer TaxID=2041049 RepID=A0AAE8MWL0_9PEZI|nr:uncharacterized protein DNG_04555 [Cephalotrichum gorgonifer]
MVDQMWVWVLDKADSILSFFPSGDLQYHGEGDTVFADLYGSVLRHSKECHDAYDFASLLVKKSIKVPFEQKNKKFADLLGIYQWATGNKSAQQAEEFENFHQGQLGIYSHASSSDNARELSLIQEVADIQDELNMLDAVLEKQSEVVHLLPSVLQNFKAKPSALPQFSEQGSLVDINNLQSHGPTRIAFAPMSNGEVHVELRQQYDGHIGFGSQQGAAELISGIGGKAGAFIEDARDELRRVTSGLPLSFFTSYFGQNVSEITGDNQNPTSAELWKIGGPITVTVVFCALLVAYYISNPTSRFWIWRKKRNDKFKV